MTQPYAERPALHPELAAKLEAAMQSPEVRAAIDLPLPTDCLRDSEFILVPRLHSATCFGLWCTIVHAKGTLIAVDFPPDWQAVMRDNGYPSDEMAEQFIESLAWRQAVRRGLLR